MTSGRASGPIVRGRRRPDATCRRRSAWRGGSSAACCSPTPSRFALLGVVIGATAKGVGDLLDSQAARDLIAKLGGSHTLVDAFLAAELGILGVVASAYTVQAVLRLRSEETSGRAEAVLSDRRGTDGVGPQGMCSWPPPGP